MIKKIKKFSIFTIILLLAIIAGSVSLSAENRKEEVQMAILLDTSSSMSGLIDQAKTQLWKIVNELATAKKNGQTPILEVALYEYGNSGLSSGEGYIRMALPLTNDLDKVSEQLFSLTTNGGDEYCGMVIESAIKGLKWNNDNKLLKVIFIAGNEPFTQGGVDYRKSCKDAIAGGIIVNTIFCGDFNEGVRTDWKNGADLADGKYMNIDQNKVTAYIEAPQDKEIAKLGVELNGTYIAYGRAGKANKMRQEEQDRNASSMSREAVIQRNMAKASSQYNNAGWDLVDAVKDKKISIDEMKEDEMPDEMKKMTGKERKEYIEKMTRKRTEIQDKIEKLNRERQKFIAGKMKEESNDTLDAVMIKAIREQAKDRNYKFE